jgi:hypothetical protein
MTRAATCRIMPRRRDSSDSNCVLLGHPSATAVAPLTAPDSAPHSALALLEQSRKTGPISRIDRIAWVASWVADWVASEGGATPLPTLAPDPAPLGAGPGPRGRSPFARLTATIDIVVRASRGGRSKPRAVPPSMMCRRVGEPSPWRFSASRRRRQDAFASLGPRTARLAVLTAPRSRRGRATVDGPPRIAETPFVSTRRCGSTHWRMRCL